MKNPKISIVDYGVGNLGSLLNAFKHFGCDARLTTSAKTIKESDAVVLPGDGSFKWGMGGLKSRHLSNTIKEFAKTKKPLLGICLGAQIMMTLGYEFGKSNGLDLIGGKVVKFPRLAQPAKIPHIGWSAIESGKAWKGTILDSVKSGSEVYFVHSFILEVDKKSEILATSTYGGVKFVSVVRCGNIYGCQFHPEKSGEVGLGIIKNFIAL